MGLFKIETEHFDAVDREWNSIHTMYVDGDFEKAMLFVSEANKKFVDLVRDKIHLECENANNTDVMVIYKEQDLKRLEDDPYHFEDDPRQLNNRGPMVDVRVKYEEIFPVAI